MITIVPFKKEHAAPILALEEYRGRVEHFPEEQLVRIEEIGQTVTILWNERVLAFGGVSLYWENRGDAWLMLDRFECKKHFIAFHRTVKRYLDACPLRRLEANVDADFKVGKRWTEMLGFNLDAERLPAFLPDGTDCSLYSRIRKVG